MKKRAAKTKRAARPKAAKKAGARSTRTATAAVSATPKAKPYTPAPLKGDGWPPFRYPLQ